MKTVYRWMLVGVFVVNSMVGAFLIGGLSSSPAGAAGSKAAADAGVEPSREALLLLGRELAARAEELSRMEAEMEEWKRGEEVRARAEAARPEEQPVAPAPEPVPAADPPAAQPAANEAFARLSKAYENMEPESAARALSELATIDLDAVMQLLVGWSPRTSGAILDALTQTHPELAATLSYEIWSRSGNDAP